jgi:hypothetical protein
MVSLAPFGQIEKDFRRPRSELNHEVHHVYQSPYNIQREIQDPNTITNQVC